MLAREAPPSSPRPQKVEGKAARVGASNEGGAKKPEAKADLNLRRKWPLGLKSLADVLRSIKLETYIKPAEEKEKSEFGTLLEAWRSREYADTVGETLGMKKGHVAKLHRAMKDLRKAHLGPRQSQLMNDLNSSKIPPFFTKFLTTAEETPSEVFLKFAHASPKLGQKEADTVFNEIKSEVDAIIAGKGGEEDFDMILDCEWKSSESSQEGASFLFHSFLHVDEGPPDIKCPEGYAIVSGFNFWTCVQSSRHFSGHENKQGIEFVVGLAKVEQADGSPIKDALAALRFRNPKVARVHIQYKGYLIAEPQLLLGHDQYRISVSMEKGEMSSGFSHGWDADWSKNLISGRALKWRS